MMTTLSEQQIIEKISQRESFEATIDSGGFTLKIERYLPVLSAAIHNGGQLREELVANCLLSQAERYYEEDPFTGSFINKQPITLTAHDSRYEYDLNRETSISVYDTAWGKDVWKTPLSEVAIKTSQDKHAQFYRIVSAVVEALTEDFGECVVYDNHSYNYLRHERKDLPVINLGTTSIKNEKWRPVIDAWLVALKGMSIEGVDLTVAENNIFYGKGYLAAYCHSRYDNVVVLATETKKVFMNELTGEAEPTVLPSLQVEYNKAIAKHSKQYIERNHSQL